MSTRIARGCVAKVSDRMVYNPLNLKILSPKEMQERLSIALAQAKAGNTSENLLNQIRKIMYSLFRAKKITKKVCYNIINSIKL